jgi:hypothetical protein
MRLSEETSRRARRWNLKETVKAPFGKASTAENIDLEHPKPMVR